MSTAVFLLGFMCVGMPGAEVCHNIASQFLYLTMQDCQIARAEILYELQDMSGLKLQCIKSDLIEAYTSYRPEVIPR